MSSNLELLARRTRFIRRRMWISTMSALIALAAVGTSSIDSATAADTILDLGTLPGRTSSLPGGINAAGQIVGGSANAVGALRGFLWNESSGMTALPTLGGDTFANAINASGQVVGRSQATGQDRAFFWSAGSSMQSLGTLPGGSISAAYAINAGGLVVGESETSAGAGTAFHAFVWDAAGGMRDLGTLPGGTRSTAWGVNDAGQIVGEADDATGVSRAFLWTPGPGMRDLGTLPGGTFAVARAINAAGQVAGWSEVAGGATHAFLWDPVTGMRDLGTLPGGTGSAAFGLDDGGRVVGGATLADGQTMRGFLWEDPSRPMRDLSPLPGGEFSVAYGINAAGQILGQSTEREDRAVRWQLNRGPTASNQTLTTPQDTALAFTLGGADPDGDTLVFTVVTGPVHGALTGRLPGVVYTPTAGYSGPDSFTFRASDGTTTSAMATVSVTVSPSAPPPPPPPSGPVKGKMFGQGRIDADGKPHHFGFRVEDGRGRGEALVLATWWRGPAPRSIVQPGVLLARSITAVQFTDDPALTPGRRPLPTADTVSFTATGTWNGRPGYVCEVTATDAGELGAGRDSFTATVRSPSGEVVATVGGLLGAGNIQSSRLRAAYAHSARY